MWSHLPILVNEKHLSLFVAISPKPIRCRRRDWLLTRCPFRIHHPPRKGTSNSCTYYHSATPAYCSPSWNRTTNISLEVRSYIHLTNRPTKHNHFTSASVKDCRANCIYNLIVFADRTGLEPATFGVTSRHSNQLNYPSNLSPR